MGRSLSMKRTDYSLTVSTTSPTSAPVNPAVRHKKPRCPISDRRFIFDAIVSPPWTLWAQKCCPQVGQIAARFEWPRSRTDVRIAYPLSPGHS